MYNIKTFQSINEADKSKIKEEIKEIFFHSTSKKNFDSLEHKEEFFNKWCGDYLRFYPQYFFLVMNQDNKCLGYLSGALDTNQSLQVLRVPGVNHFIHLYEKFPAHLHINFLPETRGQGLGSVLVKHYLDYLKLQGILGCHLITSPDALNVSFYQRLGFVHTEVYSTQHMDLLFMGRLSE